MHENKCPSWNQCSSSYGLQMADSTLLLMEIMQEPLLKCPRLAMPGRTSAPEKTLFHRTETYSGLPCMGAKGGVQETK